MMLTCRKDSGVATPADFKDKTLASGLSATNIPFMAWMAKLGLKTDGSAGGVEGHQAGLQRRSAHPEAGGLRFHTDQ